MPKYSLIPSEADFGTKRKCLSCGTNRIGTGRRYCSKECREQMVWVLSLSKGLLRAFNARYAAFSFGTDFVVLDVLPVWSREISRFLSRRTYGKKPADDLKRLVLQSGGEWYRLVNNRTSRSYASLFLLKKNHMKAIAPDSITPDERRRPRLSKAERESMKLLELKVEELFSDGHAARIKRAYKNLAKIYHPDVGGDAEKFKKLNAAHQQMLLWAEKPQFTSRKALMDCWSYDGSTNRWSPPL
jgi:predicted nucleic acid-binding Zn ribbon protein